MDRLTMMEMFCAVATEGGFSAGARKLNQSKAAVSKAVARLEQDLGTRLFNRTTRKVSLTESGELYLDYVGSILERVTEADAAVSTLEGSPRGTLRLSAPLSFGVGPLAPVLAAFMAAHPPLKVQMSLEDRLVDLVAEGFDVGLRVGRMTDSSLRVRRLGTVELVLCAAPAYLEAHGTPTTPAMLAQHRLLHYGNLGTGLSWALHGPGGEVSMKVDPVLTANNGDVLRALAEQGQGIVMQPTFIVGRSLAEGRLVHILRDHRPQSADVMALYAPQRHVPAKTRAFIDFLARCWSGGAIGAA